MPSSSERLLPFPWRRKCSFKHQYHASVYGFHGLRIHLQEFVKLPIKKNTRLKYRNAAWPPRVEFSAKKLTFLAEEVLSQANTDTNKGIFGVILMLKLQT
ncbi:hypothetical protein ILYODFUR_005062 [Ilyodon furcidens]|uniref:Uncharacterized protein n=1 Tax=Ilyodon furcidens TaxID=33524 RepID=A0ABV0U6P5_9TELE